MDVEGMFHRLASMMAAIPRWVTAATLVVGAVAAAAMPAGASVTLTASRNELLYSQDADPDCSKLHAITDDGQLPFNVARLRSSVQGAPAGQAVGYKWSLRKKSAGLLAADLDLGPGGETSAVAGMCAEFGNACILTDEKVKFYSEPTIFFIAPTCDVVSNRTEKVFRGGTSRVTLKVTAGRRKLGRATVTIGWGRNGAVQIWAENTQGVFDDGLGKPNGVNVPAVTILGANITQQPNPAPPGGLDTFFFNGENISGAESNACPLTRFEACVELDIFSVGHAFPTVEARYNDGSALCDKIEVRTGPCNPNPKLEVITKPRLRTYDPDDPRRNTVELTVRLRNASRPEGNLPPCNFLLRGAGILSCSEELKVGGLTDSKTTTFDLAHCSVTTNRGCRLNAECDPQICPDCQPNEICLTESHCSTTFTQRCQSDADCKSTGNNPPCSKCDKEERCIRVLDVPSPEIFIRAGEFFDLLTETRTLRNELPDPARITDTWTANVFIPDVSAQDKIRYRIKGRPKPPPAP
jgi:hypothetical protein